MRTLLFFLIYLGAALLLAAQLFFPVYQALAAYWEVRPDRVYYRLAMTIAILGFWPFLGALGMNNRYALGYSLDRRRFLQMLFGGLGAGILIMALHVTVLVLSGARAMALGDVQPGDLFDALFFGLIAGVLVAAIEETFFRGAVQHHLRYSHTLLTTAVMTSLFYAAVHFLRPAPVEAAAIDWNSGWQMLERLFREYQNPAALADSFAALFIAGLLLSLVRERTGHIALCIGIHAGWVLSIKLAGKVTAVTADSPAAVLIGTYDGIIGWAAAAMLGIVTLGYWLYGFWDRQ